MTLARSIVAAAFVSAGLVGFGAGSPVQAGYDCYETFSGDYKCSGTVNGQSVNTTTYKTFSGDYKTTGTVGGQNFSQTCYKTFSGSTRCN